MNLEVYNLVKKIKDTLKYYKITFNKEEIINDGGGCLIWINGLGLLEITIVETTCGFYYKYLIPKIILFESDYEFLNTSNFEKFENLLIKVFKDKYRIAMIDEILR